MHEQMIYDIVKTLAKYTSAKDIEIALTKYKVEIMSNLPELTSQVKITRVRGDLKIERIKFVRNNTDMGLKEAKDYVEETFGRNGYASLMEGDFGGEDWDCPLYSDCMLNCGNCN